MEKPVHPAYRTVYLMNIQKIKLFKHGLFGEFFFFFFFFPVLLEYIYYSNQKFYDIKKKKN